MADTLIAGTTIVESSTRSNADIPVGGIIEWDNTFASLPEGFLECDGTTVNDPLSVYNGSAVPDLNTSHVSIGGASWESSAPATDDVAKGAFGTKFDTGSGAFVADIQIPHKAVVTGAIVYGEDATNTWILNRVDKDASSATPMATGNVDTEDTTISAATIDNDNYYYAFTVTIGTDDFIRAAMVTYTPRFKFIIRIR